MVKSMVTAILLTYHTAVLLYWLCSLGMSSVLGLCGSEMSRIELCLSNLPTTHMLIL